ncbi:hypothetical protein CHUAL_012942 [Chamberlinius hualienensis]
MEYIKDVKACFGDEKHSALNWSLYEQQFDSVRDPRDCLKKLSVLLEEPTLSSNVAAHFRSILLDLLRKFALPKGGQKRRTDKLKYKSVVTSLLNLCTKFPVARVFVIKWLTALINQKEKGNRKNERDLLSEVFRPEKEFREADLAFIRSFYEFISQQFHLNLCFDWTFLLSYLNNSNATLKWFACLSISSLCHFSPVQRCRFLREHFSKEEIDTYAVNFDDAYSKSAFLRGLQFSKDYGRNWLPSICQNAEHVVNVSGVMLSKLENSKKIVINELIQVPSTVSNLRSLAIAVKRGLPVLLQGPIGCGKTALIEYLADVTGRRNRLLKIQLGEHTDSKMLLGTYQCAEGLAKFVWQPGALVKAVELGYWVLLEDLDSAPNDVISLIIPLMESRSMAVPGRTTNIKAHPDFQLFATKRLLANGSACYNDHVGKLDLINQLFTKIALESVSSAELKEIVIGKWPVLNQYVDKIVEVYLLMIEGTDVNLPYTGRTFSTRDLLKWCKRVAFNIKTDVNSSAINSFLDALDCFCYCFFTKNDRHIVSERIAAKMNITQEMARHYCDSYKPEICISDIASVGRVVMKRLSDNTEKIMLCRERKQPFAFTRESSVVLEQIAQSINNCEPVLLVGETGTGKTAAVQYLSKQLGQKLVVINMNQQSDASDFLGGFKPVDAKLSVKVLIDEYLSLFGQTFSLNQNQTFLQHVSRLFNERKWAALFKIIKHSYQQAIDRFSNQKATNKSDLKSKWLLLGDRVHRLEISMKDLPISMRFTFIEGSLVKALKEGYWVLLDEINLASAETLECLSGVLESSQGSILLLEKGELKPVIRHSNFRLLACMNAATDVGKKDLPPGLRNRFTEFYVDEPLTGDLHLLVENYLTSTSEVRGHLEGITKFYSKIKRLKESSLTDGSGLKPHFSLRNFCRALSFASVSRYTNLKRSLYEGFCFSYLTQLDRQSHALVQNCISECIFKHTIETENGTTKNKKMLAKPPNASNMDQYETFEGYLVAKGSETCRRSESYILTDSVKRNLRNLARVVSAGTCPVLLQGGTSVGKTSLIKWLADASGNRCVRVNNHEHTDLQEYVGAYCSDSNGQLVFKEGILVDAMRRGYWIVLDELNLAPTDVLEALNRVLDDNRELFITETQETVKAHPRFLLFATQNPPGLYGGRKMLSRAFRNRFIELHFEEIPSAELQMILHQRCGLPPSYCKKMVSVMNDLQSRRSSSGIFAGKQGLITIRDLFRWAERYRLANRQETRFYNWDQHLADEGYMLLAGRVRKDEEAAIIADTINRNFKCNVDVEKLFAATLDMASPTVKNIIEKVISINSPDGFKHVVWTYQMRRLAVLVGQALEFGEPVLLVGETGCGKTTVCQLLAALAGKSLHISNCHMHSEASDFLGGLRPVRSQNNSSNDSSEQRLFEWVDGHLVVAMKEGNFFLADEISLADDSVLERLNSVLEPERTLLLAEKGFGKDEEFILTAKDSFRFLATMNPGGDYGKKELSPALRNRFTEIWCPNHHSILDTVRIVEHNLHEKARLQDQIKGTSEISEAIVEFVDWFQNNCSRSSSGISIRDILSWVDFINVCVDNNQALVPLEATTAFVHGAFLVFIDAVGAGNIYHSNLARISYIREEAYKYLHHQVEKRTGLSLVKSNFCYQKCEGIQRVDDHGNLFGLNPFYIEKGLLDCESLDGVFNLMSPTTNNNLIRVLRAMQLTKPILLEGSPGLGKTSLLMALAKASGHRAVRINLSDQTDICDLFGADLPVEDGDGGRFAWRDGPLLSALKNGDWVILDELNLASQSVLEGLNACLDHRAEIYIPELGRTFRTPVQFKRRIFACQNPRHEGSARKGLPRSFQNRFTQVFMEPLLKEDLIFITKAMYPKLQSELVEQMINFHDIIHREVVLESKWGLHGGPWDINLRDLLRWCQCVTDNQAFERPYDYVKLIYADRMRSRSDKLKVIEICQQIFGLKSVAEEESIQLTVTPERLLIGYSVLPRTNTLSSKSLETNQLFILPSQLPSLQSLAKCIEMNWMSILVGPHASGKTSLVTLLAKLANQKLEVLSMNSDMDTTELLGGFEQADLNRRLTKLTAEVISIIDCKLKELVLKKNISSIDVKQLVKMKQSLEGECNNDHSSDNGENENVDVGDVSNFIRRIEMVKDILLKLHSSEDSLMKRLDQLLILAQRDGSMNYGGRFEWIDSRLVTSLQDGCWLLIDNVNLCSPSILDRLNGLMEPGGVLIVSERGEVDGDGKLPTYKPHPNFRLILSMDPKNGEISRAMRNRGVEIFLQERQTTSPGYQLELKTLLDSEGLVGCDVQMLLFEIHNRLVAENSIGLGYHKYLNSDLMRTAQLTVQRVQEGYNIIEALHDSCIDIYCRQQINVESKQLALSIVEDVLHNKKLTNEIFYQSPLMSVNDFAVVSEMGAVKADSSALVHLINHYLSSLNWNECQFLKLNCHERFQELSIHNCILSAWKFFLLKSSFIDYSLRFNYVQHLLQSIFKETDSSQISRISKIIKESVDHTYGRENVDFILAQLQSLFKDNGNEVPFDLRWNSDLFHYYAHQVPEISQLELVSSFANRLSVMLEFSMLKFTIQSVTEEFAEELVNKSKAKPLSVMRLSWAFSKGVQSDSKCPDVYITNMYNFVISLLASINDALSRKIQMSDDDVKKWNVALSHVEKFWNVCCRPGCGLKFTQDVETELYCFWTWMVENSFPVLLGTSWESDNRGSIVEMSVPYAKLLKRFQMRENSWHTFNPNVKQNFGKVIEKLLSAVESPVAFSEDREVELYKKLLKFQKKASSSSLKEADIKSLRSSILEGVLLNNSVELGLQTIGNLECDQKLEKAIVEDTELDWPAQLKPIYDQLFLLSQHKCLSEIYQFYRSGSCQINLITDQLKFVLHLGELSSHPTSVNLALLSKLEQNFMNGNVDPSLVAELQLEHFNLMLSINNNNKFETRENSLDYGVSLLNSPQHSITAANILTPILDDNSVSFCANSLSYFSPNVQLKDCDSVINTLKDLSLLFWNNIQLLPSLNKDIANFDADLLRNIVCKLNQCLADIFEINSQCANKANDELHYLTCQQCSVWRDVDLQLTECLISNLKRLKDFENTDLDRKMASTLGWICCGCIKAFLLAPILETDPIVKHKLHLEFWQDMRKSMLTDLKVIELQDLFTVGVSNFSNAHPMVIGREKELQEAELNIDELSSIKTYRPVPSQYEALRIDLVKLIARRNEPLDKTVFSILNNTSNGLFDPLINSQIKFEVHSWKEFVTRTLEEYLAYRDLLGPSMIGVLQLCYGLASYLRLKAVDDFNQKADRNDACTVVEKVCGSVLKFPNIGDSDFLSCSDLGNYYQCDEVQSVLMNIFKDNLHAYYHHQSALMKSSLLEVINQVVTLSSLRKKEFIILDKILRNFSAAWYRQNEKREKDEKEKESLFEFKAKEYGEVIDDEKQLNLSIKRLFPSYAQEYADLMPTVRLDDDDNDNENMEANMELEEIEPISKDDIEELTEMHYNLFSNYTQFSWHKLSINDNEVCDFVSPLLQRYKVGTEILRSVGDILDNKVDPVLFGGHLIAASLIGNKLASGQKSPEKPKKYNFYYDSNISEVISCITILQNFSQRIYQILNEWPDHPSLLQVLKVINRILSFSVTSPLMKFVTGFELLLGQAQEWEKNAHRGVSVMAHLEAVSQQILTWRKQELSCWSACLDEVEKNEYKAASKWWFYIYGIVRNEKSKTAHHQSVDDITKGLKQLMETSPLGEYKGRLNILTAFTYHLAYISSTDRQKEVLAIFWNVVQYYSQFKDPVQTRVKELRKTFEKELKNFVKICRWNDINFWAVRESARKSHSTLHKHIKNYENALKERAISVFNTKNLDVEMHVPKPQVESHVIVSTYKKYLQQKTKLSDIEKSLLKTTTVFLKPTERCLERSVKLCLKISKTSCFLELSNRLDSFTGDCISGMKQLQSLEVDRKASKEKQKSEANNIKVRKGKALADLFRYLRNLGLSYGKGNVICQSDPEFMESLAINPVSLNDTLSQLNEKLSIDAYLQEAWEDCPNYFYRAVSQMAVLQAVSNNPSKEFGHSNSRRSLGFSSHLINISTNQRRQISVAIDHFYRLRSVLRDCNLDCVSDSSAGIFPQQNQMKHWSDVLINLLTTSTQGISQFLTLVKTRTDTTFNDKGLAAYISQVDWLAIETSSETCLKKINDVWKKVKEHNLHCTNQKHRIYTWDHFEYLHEAYQNVFISLNDLQCLDLDSTTLFNFDETLRFLKKSVCREYSEFQNWVLLLRSEEGASAETLPSELLKLKRTAANLTLKLLHSIQEVYKLEVVTSKSDPGDAFSMINDLIEPLDNVLSQFNLEPISRLCWQLVKQWKKCPINLEPHLRDEFFYQPLPLLKQYLCIYEFYLTALVKTHRATAKLTCVLLTVFTELVVKGFCSPPELENENTDQNPGTDLKDVEGGGIGEGEGQKDVSDRLENEDQLDEAFKEGAEKKEEKNDDKDLEDEENGIEMSNDIDGKLHDVENDDDENESNDENESDDENELDKQMGDLKGEDTDKLDEKIWGSDDSDDEDESSEDGMDSEDEENGPGAGMKDETKLVAKDDNKDHNPCDDSDDEETKEPDLQKELNMQDDREYDDRPDPYQDKDNQGADDQDDNDVEFPEDMQLDDMDEKGEESENEEESPEGEIKDGEQEDEEAMETDDKEREDKILNDEDQPIDDIGKDETEERTTEEEPNEEQSVEKDESGDIDSDHDEETEDSKTEENKPSISTDSQQEAQPSDKTGESNDACNGDKNIPRENQAAVETRSEDALNDEQEADIDMDGTGQAQEQIEEGSHLGEKISSQITTQQRKEPQLELRERPGARNEKRSLGTADKPVHKRLKTDDSLLNNEEEKSSIQEEVDKIAERYSHVQDQSLSNAQVLDAATDDQMEHRATNEKLSDEDDEMKDVKPMEDQKEERKEDEAVMDKPTLNNNSANENVEMKGRDSQEMETDEQNKLENDGEKVLTLGAHRGNESFAGTNIELWFDYENMTKDRAKLREEVIALTQSLRTSALQDVDGGDKISLQEAETAWNTLEYLTLHLSQQLCEQLRLTLEPTVAAKFKGDYRTGKRLNMRKVISYIASQFRKDKIWLRRSRPSKRDYRIMIALDDSSSMVDNESKQLAFESLALITKALNLLEAGEVAVASFGESANVLHPFSQNFNANYGAHLLRKLSFEQKKTNISQMLDLAVQSFFGTRGSTNAAQLLIIISDGRGIFNEGKDKVASAVRRVKEADILTVFLVLDSPKLKDSVFDIKMPIFKPNQPIEMKSYMDEFPFPFYCVIRDVNSLPNVLGDALRQWFELVNNAER